MSAERRQKVKDLIELAFDASTSDDERGASAMTAIKLIRKYDLLSSPLDLLSSENETIQAMKAIAEAVVGQTKNVKKVADRLKRR